MIVWLCDIQPYVRQRYMSTTGEMTIESSSSGSSSRSSHAEPLKRDSSSSSDNGSDKAVKVQHTLSLENGIYHYIFLMKFKNI